MKQIPKLQVLFSFSVDAEIINCIKKCQLLVNSISVFPLTDILWSYIQSLRAWSVLDRTVDKRGDTPDDVFDQREMVDNDRKRQPRSHSCSQASGSEVGGKGSFTNLSILLVSLKKGYEGEVKWPKSIWFFNWNRLIPSRKVRLNICNSL